MKMLMFIVESDHKEKVEAALTERNVLGYTEIPTVYGIGRTGLRLGSRAFPETSSIILTVVEKDKVDDLLEAIEADCAGCKQSMRLVTWSVDTIR